MRMATKPRPFFFFMLAACSTLIQARFSQDPVALEAVHTASYKSSYSRIPEVQKRCPFPSASKKPASASVVGDDGEGGPDPNWVIQNELSFHSGEWSQASGASSPLMPYLDTASSAAGDVVDPVQLASFWITDVNVRSSHKGGPVKISAILELAVSKHRGLGYSMSVTEQFQATSYGFSAITALMEGVYFESEADRGVCMVGCTRIPRRGSNRTDPWAAFPVDDSSSSSTLRSCDLFLELHFPRKLSLRSRAVRGSLRSLSYSKKDADYFFDEIRISSQLGAFSRYEFQGGDVVDSACKQDKRQTPPPGIAVFRGHRFCATMMELVTGQWLGLAPSTSSSGPFVFKNATSSSSTSSSFVRGSYSTSPFQLRIQDVRCIDFTGAEDDEKKANVSATLRALPPNQDPYLGSELSSLDDGLAFAAEGTFRASTGELCMIGCRSNGNKQALLCDVQVSIFIPLTLSMTQRSSLVGTISSLNGSFDPASFELLASVRHLPREVGEQMTYKYSRVADASPKADEESGSLKDKLRLSVLKFPTLAEENSGQDLVVHSALIPDPSSKGKDGTTGSFLDLEVLAVEDLLLTFGDRVVDAHAAPVLASELSSADPDRSSIKIAAQIGITGPSLMISAEGVYVPRTGKLYMVGCKQQIGNASDCSISIVVQYPPKNTQWLVNPTVFVQITSDRERTDPLFFEPIRVETFPVLYSDQRREILSRKTLEGVLSALTLSLMILCIALQLIYVKKTVDSVPFISLLMLAVQAFGYSIPLITGAEALFARLTSSYDSDAEAEKASVIKDGELSHIVLYLVKILSLGAFLLMLRLCQKVVKSRIRLATRFPLEPRRVPSEKKAIKIFFLVHLVGFCTVLLFHYILRSSSSSSSYQYSTSVTNQNGTYLMSLDENRTYLNGSVQKQDQEWIKELKEYVGLVQDLFLLPQVIATSIWEIKGKPLRPAYYVGITALRLLPHIYNALRKPLFNPYFADESSVFANPGMDFYTRAGDLLIPLMAVALAGAVYAEQRWNGLRWGKVLRTGSSKLMRYGSKLYERLPSQGVERNFEAELMPSFPAGAEDHSLLDAEDGKTKL